MDNDNRNDFADNMAIWSKVDETRPSETKAVKFGRTFTAIDAYAQIKNATRVFGPVGYGFGWSAKWDHSISGVIGCDLVFWYIHAGSRCEFDSVGSCDLGVKNVKDSDAKKKALTDAITKALSYLGFNADVFLGKFDDNRYVAEMRAKEQQEQRSENQSQTTVSSAVKERKAKDTYNRIRRASNDESTLSIWEKLGKDEKIDVWQLMNESEKKSIQDLVAKSKTQQREK
jgi:hypothetical protein